MSLRDLAGGVSREHPWPGLTPFTEEARDFFHGRDEELAELLRLIRRETLTVLFGLSGLGKSSLLNAGLFPRLREEDFLPTYIRLDVLGGRPLAAEALRILVESAAAAGVEAPAPRPGDTLWEYFHRRDADFWSPKNRLLTPVMVFDQFEELFTLGRHGADTVNRCLAFLDELAELVEDRTPASVLAAIEADPARAEELDYGRRTFKVVLAFREDYLPEFEALRAAMPSIMRGRLRLTRMNGAQARQAILQSGGHLVKPEVADLIIRFVASPRRRGEGEPELERLEVEPALLSVVCRELNNQRIARGQTHITADLLEGGAQHEIIGQFYEEALQGLDPRVREFVEDQLLTESGYRDSYALEDAVRLPGITREAIDALIARRLVRLDERSGVLRVELTHDLLTRVAKESRDARLQREKARIAREADAARRRRVAILVSASAAVVVAAVALAATFAVLLERSNEEKRRLVETQSNVLLDQAIGQLERNVPSEPQAILAEAMRLNPENSAAVARAVTYLSHRAFAREVSERKLEASQRGVDLRARAFFATGKQPGFSVVDLETGALLAPERKLARALNAMAISADRTRIAWDEADGKVAVARPGRPDSVAIPLDGRDAGATIRALVLSDDGNVLAVRTEKGSRLYLLEPAPVPVAIPDDKLPEATADSPVALGPRGEWVAFGGRRGVLAWNRTDGRSVSLAHPSPVNALEFSADGAYLVSASQDKYARLWELRTGRLVGSPMPHEGAVLSAALAADAERVVTGSLDRTARVWSVPASTPLVEPLVAATPVVQARLKADGRGAATLDAGGRLALWDFVTAEAPRPLAAAVQGPAALEASADGLTLAVSSNGVLRVFDTAAGASPRQRWQQALGGEAMQVGFGGEGKYLAVGLADGSVQLREGATGALARTLRQPSAARLMAFSPGGATLAVASEDDVIRIWEVATGNLVGLPMESASSPVKLQFSPRGESLLALHKSGRVRVWDAANTLPIASIEPSAEGSRVAFVAFTGKGRELVVVEAHLARLLDIRQLPSRGYEVAVLGRLPLLTTTWSADLSAATRRLVVAGVDGGARLVDLDHMRLTGNAMKHDGVVVGIAFSPDGRWVVTRTEQAARLWDARTGFPVTDVLRHEQRVAGASLVGGGAYLVTHEEGAAPRLMRAGLDFPLPYPAWLPALVELAGRGRFDKSGTVAPIDNARGELAALRETMKRESASSWWREWGTQVLARLDGEKASGGKP